MSLQDAEGTLTVFLTIRMTDSIAPRFSVPSFTCAMTSHSQMPPMLSATPSPTYDLPLFRLPFGMESSIGGPTAVGIGLRTSRVPGSR